MFLIAYIDYTAAQSGLLKKTEDFNFFVSWNTSSTKFQTKDT